MLRIAVIILVGCSALIQCIAQAYTIAPVQGINTANDEVASMVWNNQLVYCTNYRQDLVNDYDWDKHYIFRMEMAGRQKTFLSYNTSIPFLHSAPLLDEGSASFSAGDSILYFSSANNYGKSKGSNLKIFTSKWNGINWSEPCVISFCNQRNNFAHPWYDEQNNLLVFSSDKSGGSGAMDIWYCYKTQSGYTAPVNLGFMINTTGNEIFPTVFEGDIYFATNGYRENGDYELFKALIKYQWQSTIQLPEPLNSLADDVRILFLNDQKGFVTSNRLGGVEGDDIYLFQKQRETNEMHNYAALLLGKNTPLLHIGIAVINALGEVVLENATDSTGTFNVKPLDINRSYTLETKNIDPIILAETVLYIVNEKNERIQAFYPNADGTFELELLPFNNIDLLLTSNEDKSLLTINLQGQVYDEKPGDIDEQEMITIVDERGETVAITYTKNNGKFHFKNLFPELNYTFRLADESKAKNVLLLDKGKDLTLPVLKEEATYHRLKANEAIRLVNELNENIYIAPEDVFVVNRIYYQYNSAELTAQAHEQLEQLVLILKKNPRIKLEIRSYTDARGTEEYNQHLSDKRVMAVSTFLVEKGIKEDRLSGKGMGESQLLNNCFDNCDEVDHAINRRTEIRLIEK